MHWCISLQPSVEFNVLWIVWLCPRIKANRVVLVCLAWIRCVFETKCRCWGLFWWLISCVYLEKMSTYMVHSHTWIWFEGIAMDIVCGCFGFFLLHDSVCLFIHPSIYLANYLNPSRVHPCLSVSVHPVICLSLGLYINLSLFVS